MKTNNKFSNCYLAGLFEGKGHIWMPKENVKHRKNPKFCITFKLKNEPLAKKLLELIGHGYIKYKIKQNVCILIVSKVKGLKILIKKLNGEIRTPKYVQFYNLIDWMNKNHQFDFPKLPLKNTTLRNNNWLAGFIDTGGSFYIQHSKIKDKYNETKGKISCRLRIEHILEDPIYKKSYENIFLEISKFLNCNLKIRKQLSTNDEYFHITASSRISLTIAIRYFERHSLYSSKYLEYKCWKQAVDLILENKHHTEKGMYEIYFLKKKMNLKRIDYDWCHLNKFK